MTTTHASIVHRDDPACPEVARRSMGIEMRVGCRNYKKCRSPLEHGAGARAVFYARIPLLKKYGSLPGTQPGYFCAPCAEVFARSHGLSLQQP